MTTAPTGSGSAPAASPDIPADRPRVPGERRLLTGLMANSVVLYAVYGAVPSVLLANLVADVDPGSKSTSLGIISAIGAFGAMLANPIAGALSDRTHGRFGRRAPWMAGGALLGGLALIAVGAGNGLLWICVAWTLAQIFLNGLQAPLTAVIPDRTPEGRRGLFSSAAGLAQMLGATVGTAVAAGFADALGLGFAVFGVLVILGTAVFLLLNREPAAAAPQGEPFRWKTFLAGFWVSPRRHPDFAWAFLGRFLLILGYYCVFSYQLYVLDDYLGLTRDRANDLVPLLSLAMLPGMIVMIVVSGPWSDRVGRRKPFVIAASLGMAIALTLPLVLRSEASMFVYAVLSGCAFGMYMAVDTALMTQVLPRPDEAAKDMGVLNIANALPQALAPAVAAGVIGLVGGYRSLFVTAILLVVLGALSIVPIRSVR
ncbi:MFS transporter [Streptomyces sanglieri]|uniref:MFS transporter n=1 Tax=Streptomyces sanglieri TaxID=193460 RepID=A0ABW2WMT1_9ACTN|nr:MFS transporter [Streptomyces sp. Wh19]MDV9201467.1 MFS transporter [Streptomyces sp. Wh19]